MKSAEFSKCMPLPYKPKAWNYVTSKSLKNAYVLWDILMPVILKQTPDGEVKGYVLDTWSIKQELLYY